MCLCAYVSLYARVHIMCVFDMCARGCIKTRNGEMRNDKLEMRNGNRMEMVIIMIAGGA